MIPIINQILSDVKKSKHYSTICDDTVRRICEEEMPKYKHNKDITKSVKNRLHSMYNAYFSENSYKKARKLLSTFSKDSNNLEEIASEIITLHTSSKERMVYSDEFYNFIFSNIPNIESILDIGCGFNPFFLSSYLKNNSIHYYATDISCELIDLINDYFTDLDMSSDAFQNDIICNIPNQKVTVAFLFKILPLLEQQSSGSSLEILKSLHADWIVVTFPLKSLSGKNVGMKETYTNWFANNIAEEFPIEHEAIIGNELIYIVRGAEK